MKYLIYSLLLVGTILQSSFAQVIKPISWESSILEENVEVGDTATISFRAKIDENWYLYSSDFDPDLGPMLTEFEFVEDDSYQLVDSIIPINPSEGYDEIWEGNYTYFKKNAEFQQKVIIKEIPFRIETSNSYQVCSDVDGKCIPFSDDFLFGKKLASKKDEAKDSKVDKEVRKDKVEGNSGLDLTQKDSTSPYSLLGFMLVAFLAGLAALLTPCVFPMIPMTVTFFTGKAKTRAGAIRQAVIYGLSIVVIYVVAGTIIAVINGPEFANWLSTHWIPNVFFFLVFFIFALSFLGLFEINLPSSFVNKVDAKADKGGLGGVFFMAFTLVLVSFSCTGPIVGSILVESAGGMVIKPLLGMFAFSMAFAIPFTLFAIFPEWLNNLPKSGGWLNSVKVVLGFLELALGLKFLSIADQVYHWGILDRDIYLVLWIVIFGMLGLYLLGKLRLPGDSPIEKLSVSRLMLSIVTFSFVLYMIPGLFGAPLKALSGYLPPMSSHDFDLPTLIRENSGGSVTASSEDQLCEEPKYADMLHFPHGIKGYFDYEQALACAKEQGKPIFVDFTGHGCVNCREMEARVWSDPKVLSRLKNDFVMLALYVDEKTELPESEWYTSEYDGKVKKTMGKQNADFQITRFNNNAQPYYVLLDTNGELLVEPIAYERSISKFVDFLETAKEKFEAKNKP
ncbi:protein-disulfide reductase DsbD family protein [Marivirga arenosa]|uniref:Cytochrome c biogenesis protein CcdA n=1 Tax=Marivirga arenosa TaxID=3059076 RepID=A0AA51ZWH2_9BACT|nr:cytochrome c biogenesis protein CcdA [Marivirga sp. BKB1-2]WNB18001.1 cytochrome c biogenesis protein CcdA [Marivirga sp. BKB1-2]